jgi:hypothetical protein
VLFSVCVPISYLSIYFLGLSFDCPIYLEARGTCPRFFLFFYNLKHFLIWRPLVSSCLVSQFIIAKHLLSCSIHHIFPSSFICLLSSQTCIFFGFNKPDLICSIIELLFLAIHVLLFDFSFFLFDFGLFSLDEACKGVIYFILVKTVNSFLNSGQVCLFVKKSTSISHLFNIHLVLAGCV